MPVIRLLAPARVGDLAAVHAEQVAVHGFFQARREGREAQPQHQAVGILGRGRHAGGQFQIVRQPLRGLQPQQALRFLGGHRGPRLQVQAQALGRELRAIRLVAGGLLDGAQIDDLIAFMETWETDDAPPLPEPNLTTEIERVSGYEGDPQAGATVYAKFCYGCHGEQGEGRGQPIFSPIRRTSEIRQIVGLGYNSEYMPAFGAEAGGPLSDEDMDNLIAYVASWPLERAAAGESDTPIGLNLLIVFMGAAAIIGVAGVYLTNVVRTES